jgi:hypothetical protein
MTRALLLSVLTAYGPGCATAPAPRVGAEVDNAAEHKRERKRYEREKHVDIFEVPEP